MKSAYKPQEFGCRISDWIVQMDFSVGGYSFKSLSLATNRCTSYNTDSVSMCTLERSHDIHIGVGAGVSTGTLICSRAFSYIFTNGPEIMWSICCSGQLFLCFLRLKNGSNRSLWAALTVRIVVCFGGRLSIREDVIARLKRVYSIVNSRSGY
jgi:hypothetical protein